MYDEHRFAQARGLHLDATRVGEDKVARGHGDVKSRTSSGSRMRRRSKSSSYSCAASRTSNLTMG